MTTSSILSRATCALSCRLPSKSVSRVESGLGAGDVKRSKAETAETRHRIVETAAREFRSNGIHATGLADVMASSCLRACGTSTGTFNPRIHCDRSVCAAELNSIVESAAGAARQSDRNGELEAIIESYVSVNYRDDRAGGCPLAGLREASLREPTMKPEPRSPKGFCGSWKCSRGGLGAASPNWRNQTHYSCCRRWSAPSRCRASRQIPVFQMRS